MLETPKPLEEMTKLVDFWIAHPKDDGARKSVLELLETPEYRDMGGAGNPGNYVLRNRPFLTAHKLKTFRQNPWFAWMAYEEEIIMPFEDPEHFVDGQAVDDLLTTGEKNFAERYATVDSRIDDPEQAIIEIDARIKECQNDLKKDGTRSLTGIKGEEIAKKRREFFEGLRGKIQLTETRTAMVRRAAAEYKSRHFFPDQPVKQNIVFLMFEKFPFKMELDHLEFGSHFGDIKTTASIETFDPMKWDYPFTMGVYYHGIRELYDEKLPGRLYVLDKNKDYCRSDCYEYSVATLEDQQAAVMNAAEEYVKCRKSKVWPWKLDLNRLEDRKNFFRSKFYAHPLCQQFKDKMKPITL